MATIERRTNKAGEAVYRARIRMKGYVQDASFKRLTDAKRWIRSIEAAIDEDRFKTKESMKHTLSEAIERYKREVMVNLSASEIPKRIQQFRYWSNQIGDFVLADVTPALIVEHKGMLASGITRYGTKRKPASVNRFLAALSAVLTVAKKEWQWLEVSPMDQVSKLKEPPGRVRYLSDDERARLLDACKQSTNGDLYLAVVLGLSTGARQGEIMGLRWPDVDMQRSMIIIQQSNNDERHSKNGERRSVPLIGQARELLKERNKVRRIDTDLIFPGRVYPPKPIDLRRPWLDALKAAEIEDFRWHDLRHSAASYLAMNGATPSELAAVLGHKTLQMVKRYAHLSEQHTVDVLRRMNRAIFE